MIKFKKFNLPKQNWKVGVIKTYGRFVCTSLKEFSASENKELIPFLKSCKPEQIYNNRPIPFENFSKTDPPLVPVKPT